MEENNHKYGKLVRISQSVLDHIGPKIKYPESFSDALERELKIKKEEKNASKRKSKTN